MALKYSAHNGWHYRPTHRKIGGIMKRKAIVTYNGSHIASFFGDDAHRLATEYVAWKKEEP